MTRTTATTRTTETVLLPSEVWRLILQFKSDALHTAATKIQAVARGVRPREEWGLYRSGYLLRPYFF
jgi:hypothetical protein